MASTVTLSPVDCAYSPSHNIKPGRRRSGVHFTALLFCIAFLSILGQVQAAALHHSGVDRILRAIVARQDPLSSSAPPSTPAPLHSHSRTSVVERPKTPSTTSTTSSQQSSPSNGSAAATSAPPQLTALPKAFDSIIGNNFTNKACPQFLEGLSENDSFNNCLPLSIIMQSESFFEDSTSPALLNDVLDATCNVDLNDCQNLMSSLAVQLRLQANCGGDYSLGNPVVLDAYNGFLSYTPLYRAGCLKTSSASSTSDSAGSTADSASQYCYATASNNETASLNGYIYSLPLGSPLPSSGNVDCTTCLQQTMGFFASAATNATSPMASLYNGAANEINSHCGASWVKPNVTVNQSTENSSGVRQSQVSVTLVIAMVVMLAMA